MKIDLLYKIIFGCFSIMVGCSTFMLGQSSSHFFHKLNTQNNLSSQSKNLYIYKDRDDIVWISSLNGINRFHGNSIKQYLPQKGDSTSLRHGVIQSAFFEDLQKNIWFSTVDALHIYNRQRDNFKQIPIYYQKELLEGYYFILKMDKEGEGLWFRINNSLYRLLNKSDNEASFIGDYPINFLSTIEKINHNYWLFTPLRKGLFYQIFDKDFREIESDTLIKDFHTTSIHVVNEDEISVGTTQGLVQLSLKNKAYIHKDRYQNRNLETINSIARLDSVRLVVATNKQGIFIFSLEKNEFENEISVFDGEKVKSFPHLIERIYIDKDKVLWISTDGRGVFFTSLNKKIQNYFQIRENESAKKAFISSITSDSKDNIWCLNQQGITKIREAKGVIQDTNIFIANNKPFNRAAPNFIYADAENTIWTSDHFAGVYYKKEDKEIFLKARIKGNRSNDRIGLSIIHPFNNKTYISSTKGIFRWNSDKLLLEKITGTFINDGIFSWIETNQDANQIIFRKSQSSFLIGHFQQGQDTFQVDTTLNFKPFVNYLHHDTIANRYWLATSEGLHWIDYKRGQYELKEDTVLRYKTLRGVLKEDDSDNLWLSSNRGIIKYNFKTGEQRVYGLADGVQSLEFNYWSSYKSKSGKLMFGGVNGLNVFDPKTIREDAKPASPTITSMLINDEPPKTKLICEKTKSQNISYIEHLEFNYDQNTLSFYFAALDYVDPDANQYRYRMKAQEDKWVFSDTKNFARYANLSPDSYVFEVDATNSDGVWSDNPAQLRITIHPPWYQTWYAYLGYALSSILLLLVFYRFQITQRLKEAEAYRLKELDQIKTALYTNITHEFRTPLTIILGMADQIKEKPKKGFQEGLEMIRRSGQNLLNLVNQMLDLAKIESGNMQAKYVQGNIVHYLQYIVEAFQSYTDTKKIKLVFYNEISELVMDYDEDKLQTILVNLLSNAAKFTPEEGKIIVHLNQWRQQKEDIQNNLFCQIKIKDNGIGIDEKDLPHIFDRFYQIDDTSTRSTGGTGIGLALTKELVELMDGTITVHSQLNKGTEFIILLPISRTAPVAKDYTQENLIATFSPSIILTNDEQKELQEEGNDSLPLILIIEDNLDVITYLQSCLEDDYRTAIALDGQAGIEKALALIPDIIITDVMMPRKDGYEVCEYLKEDERSSHIPIIMLTAKAQIENKIAGLSKGADAYLSKPFHQKELNVRLEQLLLQRKRLQTYYSQTNLSESIPEVKDPFIEKVIDLVEAELSADFNLDEFCQLLAMSRSQVYRKIKALTGYSTTIFIRRIRLKHAYQLLTTTDKSVSEVAYEVGFKDPSFFSRSFSEVFQKSPTEVKAKKV